MCAAHMLRKLALASLHAFPKAASASRAAAVCSKSCARGHQVCPRNLDFMKTLSRAVQCDTSYNTAGGNECRGTTECHILPTGEEVAVYHQDLKGNREGPILWD